MAQEEQFLESVRNNKENLAIIVHGWREGCSVNWAKTLIRNLNEFRGGTIICMDYSYFSLEESYFKLVRHFDPIAEVLKTKLVQLDMIPRTCTCLGLASEASWLWRPENGLESEESRRSMVSRLQVFSVPIY